eukprot:TRINITY_DN7351_c0_g2_i2.p1 TRINITY_DN7351_c0_g2~~TRINITY_DN7351_c0_g2_i2.p1  ORF type:complete len:353 (+),score=46.84 TRINITY_DN7351_c0_g2_i2:40-1098(+)
MASPSAMNELRDTKNKLDALLNWAQNVASNEDAFATIIPHVSNATQALLYNVQMSTQEVAASVDDTCKRVDNLVVKGNEVERVYYSKQETKPLSDKQLIQITTSASTFKDVAPRQRLKCPPQGATVSHFKGTPLAAYTIRAAVTSPLSSPLTQPGASPRPMSPLQPLSAIPPTFVSSREPSPVPGASPLSSLPLTGNQIAGVQLFPENSSLSSAESPVGHSDPTTGTLQSNNPQSLFAAASPAPAPTVSPISPTPVHTLSTPVRLPALSVPVFTPPAPTSASFSPVVASPGQATASPQQASPVPFSPAISTPASFSQAATVSATTSTPPVPEPAPAPVPVPAKDDDSDDWWE